MNASRDASVKKIAGVFIVVLAFVGVTALLMSLLTSARMASVRSELTSDIARYARGLPPPGTAEGLPQARDKEVPRKLARVKTFSADIELTPGLSVGTERPESIYEAQFGARIAAIDPDPAKGECEIHLPLPPQLISLADVKVTVNGEPSESIFVEGDRMVMLVCGQLDNGQLDVLGFCVSTGEQCSELLGDLRRRGLEGVELFVSDGSGAIRSALEQTYPEVAWQSCTFHRLSALRADVGPTNFRDLMVAEAACIFRCPSKLAAADAAAAWAHRWRPSAPWAVQQFMDGLQDSLMFYNLPQVLWRRVRTNNPLERLIRTLRMRLRPMGCFHDPPAIQRAVFGQLLRWHKVKLTHNT